MTNGYTKAWQSRQHRRSLRQGRTVMKIMVGVLLLAWLIPTYVAAEDFIYIPDMSRLKWQLVSGNGVVYFRNLNEFDSTFLPCCYNYWLDTSTPEGKSAWAVILVKIHTAQSLYLSVTNKTQPGSINLLGTW